MDVAIRARTLIHWLEPIHWMTGKMMRNSAR